MVTTLHATKGHGTENDFIVIDDERGAVSLSAELVRRLCDRHAGIGADGVLRVLRTAESTEPDVRAQASEATWFMDYRNADGSIAEMCGNGVRVFARYLESTGRIDPGKPVMVATRGGAKRVRLLGDVISVEMGRARLRPERPAVHLNGRSVALAAVALEIPNPHVVVELADLDELWALDLSSAPVVSPALPDGQNVEFVVRTGPTGIAMRVHERGVGETRSCGTGICAAVTAIRGGEDGQRLAGPEWQVEVPGGICTVSWTETGEVVLTGPAELVATFELTDSFAAAAV